MSDIVRQVARYYELGLWSEQRVKNAVKKGAISAEEYTEITGRVYSE